MNNIKSWELDKDHKDSYAPFEVILTLEDNKRISFLANKDTLFEIGKSFIEFGEDYKVLGYHGKYNNK